MWAYLANWPTLSPRLHKADLLEFFTTRPKNAEDFLFMLRSPCPTAMGYGL
jgi:hypothetical protein